MRVLFPRPRADCIFAALFLLLFGGMNLAYYSILNLSLNLVSLLYAWLLEFAAFGLAYECTESLLVLLLTVPYVSRSRVLEDCPPVALVCCTCDDVDVNVLRQLGNQTYTNVDVFILDDSQHPAARALVDSLGFTVMRRPDHSGYKAGNLNYWLSLRGSSYPYMVVADSDSILPPRFIQDMVAYAEHPENKRIAVFESLIRAWNVARPFSNLQDQLAPVMHQYNLIVDTRLDSTLSSGHNNLYRTAVLKSIGGFPEGYIAEDYATCLTIRHRTDYGYCTVPVLSYERLPENLQEYARRQARWALQTFQLLSIDVSWTAWTLWLKLLKALHYYTAPVAAHASALLLITLGMWQPSASISFERGDIVVSSGYAKVFLLWSACMVVPHLLRGIIGYREGVPASVYVKSIAFHEALFVATIWPVTRRLFRGLIASDPGFTVTGKWPAPSMAEIFRMGWLGFALVWLALCVVVRNPVLMGLNLVWIIPGCLSPFVIAFAQRDSV